MSRIDLELDDIASPAVASVGIAADSGRRPTSDLVGRFVLAWSTANEPCFLKYSRRRHPAEPLLHLAARRSRSLPTTMQVRDATVGPLSGTSAVSAS